MSKEKSPGLTCHRISKVYASKNGVVPALEDVSFSVAKDEFVCIVGPSGCGKSTLMKILAGLIKPTTGELIYEESPAKGKPRNALVFQEHGLLPWMTLLDNVALGLEMQGIPSKERYQRTREFLDQVGLSAFAGYYPHELSMGMRQRAALVRALLSDPLLLLMDEPFSSLDSQIRLVLQEELLRIWRDQRKMVVFVTHDIEEAILLGDRVLVMSGRPGRIQAEFRIPLGRPRNLRDDENPEVQEIKWNIWKAIEQEVRRSLQVPV
jgi:NitT/TauT family transport system ATP-binding protein